MSDSKALADEILRLHRVHGDDAFEIIVAKLDIFAHEHHIRGFDEAKRAIDGVFAKWRGEADAQRTAGRESGDSAAGRE